MSTFTTFRDGLGGIMSRNLLGLDVSGLMTWRAFTDAAVRLNDRTKGGLVETARKRAVCSSGERALLCAILAAADFAWLADELAGTETWDRFGRLSSDYRLAVAAAIARQDG